MKIILRVLFRLVKYSICLYNKHELISELNYSFGSSSAEC